MVAFEIKFKIKFIFEFETAINQQLAQLKRVCPQLKTLSEDTIKIS